MIRNPRWTSRRLAALGAVISFLGACSPDGAPPPVPPAEIPVTSSSPEAVELYHRARDLSERMRNVEAYELYRQAVEKDPDFALAYLAMADVTPTTGEAYEAVDRAAALVDRVSEPESWWILGRKADLGGDPETQERYYERLVEAYPSDVRVRQRLALSYLRQQRYAEAVEHLEHAIAVQPGFPPAYNLLGYAHKTLGDYAAAEAAFRKSTELLPGEANPLDSYGELLMKLGRFEESIEHYEKALAIDPSFLFSRLGIGANYVFLERYDEAGKLYDETYASVGTDGQRRRVLLHKALSHLHQDDDGRALEEVGKRLSLAESAGDHTAWFDDLILMGNILLEAGDPGGAETKFNEALEVLERADVADDVKETARRNRLYHQARVALERKDLETASARSEEYAGAIAATNTFETRRRHELEGRIALARGDFETALAGLAEADQEDARILYYQALAHRGRGDREKTAELAGRAAGFNDSDLNYAFAKRKAERLLAEESAR